MNIHGVRQPFALTHHGPSGWVNEQYFEDPVGNWILRIHCIGRAHLLLRLLNR